MSCKWNYAVLCYCVVYPIEAVEVNRHHYFQISGGGGGEITMPPSLYETLSISMLVETSIFYLHMLAILATALIAIKV